MQKKFLRTYLPYFFWTVTGNKQLIFLGLMTSPLRDKGSKMSYFCFLSYQYANQNVWLGVDPQVFLWHYALPQMTSNKHVHIDLLAASFWIRQQGHSHPAPFITTKIRRESIYWSCLPENGIYVTLKLYAHLT